MGGQPSFNATGVWSRVDAIEHRIGICLTRAPHLCHQTRRWFCSVRLSLVVLCPSEAHSLVTVLAGGGEPQIETILGL